MTSWDVIKTSNRYVMSSLNDCVPTIAISSPQKKALMIHNKVSHLGLREFVCLHEECGRAFGYKHLLQRHLAKLHSDTVVPPSDELGIDPQNQQDNAEISDTFDIDDITGVTYDNQAQEKMQSSRSLLCPHPHLHDLLESPVGPSSIPGSSRKCGYVFTRAYDIRRHLRAIHGVDVEKDRVENWVKTNRGSTPT